MSDESKTISAATGSPVSSAPGSLIEAAARVVRKAGFFPWGDDSWCHDLDGIGVVTTAEALDLLYQDERIADEFFRKVRS